MKYLFCFILAIPMTSLCQNNKIEFKDSLTWDQVKAKAKAENKFIFLDCYASWCIPCKEMDVNVYTNYKVADYFNSNFISFRLQLDTTKNDRDYIVKNYQTSNEVLRVFNIHAFPTFLFFSPSGKIVHMEVGLQSPDSFIATGADAIDSNFQFFTLKDKFAQHNLQFTKYIYLANISKKLEMVQLADSVSREYFNNYLLKGSKEQIITAENLGFLNYFSDLMEPNDRVYEIVENNQFEIDKIIYLGYAQNILDNVVFRVKIRPFLYRDGKMVATEPPWSRMKKEVQDEFGKAISDRTILNAKISWHYNKQNWKKLIPEYIRKNEIYGIDTVGAERFQLNNLVYNIIFMHSKSKVELEKGLKWMKILITDDPKDGIDIDTYANLLYKIGRKHEAIAWEKKASQLSPLDPEIKANLKLMETGKATWAID